MPLLQNLILVFASFLTIIMAFCFIYSWLYKQDHHHFVFNADIVKRQRVVARIEWEKDLSNLSRTLSFVEELQAALVSGTATILPESAPGDVVTPSGYTYRFIPFPTSPSTPPIEFLYIFDEQNRLVDNYCPGWPATDLIYPHHFREACLRYIGRLENRCERLKEQLGSIETEAPQIWSFWDFLYFSLVIQTTIGLGDILPNSTLIRKLVILQTIFGYAILVVFLNLVLSR